LVLLDTTTPMFCLRLKDNRRMPSLTVIAEGGSGNERLFLLPLGLITSLLGQYQKVVVRDLIETILCVIETVSIYAVIG